MLSDICRNGTADCEYNFANKLLQDNNFFPQEVLDNISATKEELNIALKYAIAYDSFDEKIQRISQEHLELLIWLHEMVEIGNGVFVNDYFNGKKLDDVKLREISELQYEFMSSSEDVIKFYPIYFINKLATDNWQIEFNPLFEKLCIIIPNPFKGLLDAIKG
ncbi:hypothetical protein SAMN06313486_10113 [Epsilonproteobacteria bacterium SCGC AD-308-P11]|nr:hypothetical protein SAMN06313486_10113 [Epsilonproteobacteria bacterium SCGC AD-308-P11]